MNSDNFQEAKRIYSAALERDPAQRDAYLSEACQGNDALRNEVESLLRSSAEGNEFFKAPAIEAGAIALAREVPKDYTGQTLSHYSFLEKIGEGGMGVVYRARDMHLDREVALKILPPEKLLDPDRKRRFVQEAKAASALNHPNTVVIHDIDTAEGATFIAMELVKGKTLNEILCARKLTQSEMLRYAEQIADALATAHSSGIIHRDIKPANIMITDSGIVKVLDFGLAKLTEITAAERDGSSDSALLKTEAGLILGTVAYMSPEQAEGKEVDARSDIFSFGSVLYEMTTGRRPFSGETNASTLAAILRDQPQRVSQIAPGIPRELEGIVHRCLQKAPGQRFQSMADLRAAVEQVKQDSETRTLMRARPRGVRSKLILTVSACLLIAVVAALWVGLRGRPTAQEHTLVKTFTGFPGVETRAVFSPDGKQLAFSWNGPKQDNFDIYVQLVDEAIPHRVTTDPAFDYSPVWSPDALHIAFLRDTPSGTEVIVVPASGGLERKLHTSSVRMLFALPLSGLAWSPDGRFLAIVDRNPTNAVNSLFLLDPATRESRRLTNPPVGSWDSLPSFSPDNRTLAFIRGYDRPLSDIYVVPLSTDGRTSAEPRRITFDNTFIYGLDWTADNRELVFASTRGGLWSLWRVKATGGEPQRLSVGGNTAFWPTVAKQGNRLAYTEGLMDFNIWRVGVPGNGTDGAAGPMRITSSPQLDEFPAFSPDGEMIAWSSTHSGSHQIWVAKNDGSNPTQLTRLDPPGAALPLWSPDGHQIAFEGYSRGPHHIYVMSADGGSPRCLTPGAFDEDLDGWSRDSKWVYFDSTRNGAQALSKVSIDGGNPIVVAPGGWGPVESKDGNYIYYSGLDQNIWRLSIAGGTPVRVAQNGWRPLESSDGKYIYYSGPGPRIWRLAEAGGEPNRVLTIGPHASWILGHTGVIVLDPDVKGGPDLELFPFNSTRPRVVRLPGKADGYGKEDLSPLSISPDGRWILYVHVDRDESDIMMAENFR